MNAVAYSIAEQYVDAFGKLAKTNNTMILPANSGDVGGMVAQVSLSCLISSIGLKMKESNLASVLLM